MTMFLASSPNSVDIRSNLVRRIAFTAVLGAFALSLLLAASASALVTEVSGTKAGVTPRNRVSLLDGNGAEGATFANPAGNPVMHGSNVYVVYWDPTDHYHGDWQEHIDVFMQEVGEGSGSLANVFAVPTQYTDKTNVPSIYSTTFHGAYTDTHPYPAAGCTDPKPLVEGDAITCLTDHQIQEALQGFITEHALPKGMASIYYLLTPPGVTVCLDSAATHCSDYSRSVGEVEKQEYKSASYRNSFCSYHSDINPGALPTGDANTILYGDIPWTAGGFGAYHLALANQTAGFECQDGGFDPSTNPAEKFEAPAELTKKQEEEFEEDNKTQKEEFLLKEEREGPHQEEPNQLPVGPDGAPDTGLSDLIINQISVQQQDIVSDPLLNSWQDSVHDEASDECSNYFATGKLSGSSTVEPGTLSGTLANEFFNNREYYLQTAFNLAADKLPYPAVPCLGGISLQPVFTAPNTVNVGDIVGFNGMESNISLNGGINYSGAGAPKANYATYTWNFGDGTSVVSGFAPGAPLCETPWLSPCAASVFHSYAAGGTYPVTLTVTDIGGNTASITHEVIVRGTPPAPGTTGTTVVQGAPGSSSSAATGGATGASVPAPVAVAAVTSRSLRSVLKKGLVVRYSVNEQVAGHFEVLLSRTLAKRLKIGGAPATGLPAGTPPQLVIAKAVLITTKGGHSTVAIKFSKTVAKRLSKTHKVSLLLRLIVRNASKSPASTTVLSTVTLAG